MKHVITKKAMIAGTTLELGALRAIPIIATELHVIADNFQRAAWANKRVLGVILMGEDDVRAVGVDGETLELKELRRLVPELDDRIVAR